MRPHVGGLPIPASEVTFGRRLGSGTVGQDRAVYLGEGRSVLRAHYN